MPGRKKKSAKKKKPAHPLGHCKAATLKGTCCKRWATTTRAHDRLPVCTSHSKGRKKESIRACEGEALVVKKKKSAPQRVAIAKPKRMPAPPSRAAAASKSKTIRLPRELATPFVSTGPPLFVGGPELPVRPGIAVLQSGGRFVKDVPLSETANTDTVRITEGCLAGKVIAPLNLAQKIGSGAYGVVSLLCYSPLNCPVVLKVVPLFQNTPDPFIDRSKIPEIVAQFIREAKLTEIAHDAYDLAPKMHDFWFCNGVQIFDRQEHPESWTVGFIITDRFDGDLENFKNWQLMMPKASLTSLYARAWGMYRHKIGGFYILNTDGFTARNIFYRVDPRAPGGYHLVMGDWGVVESLKELGEPLPEGPVERAPRNENEFTELFDDILFGRIEGW